MPSRYQLVLFVVMLRLSLVASMITRLLSDPLSYSSMPAVLIIQLQVWEGDRCSGAGSFIFLLSERLSLQHPLMKSWHGGRWKGSNHSTVDSVVGCLRSSCNLLDFFGVWVSSVRGMIVELSKAVESLMDGVEVSGTASRLHHTPPGLLSVSSFPSLE